MAKTKAGLGRGFEALIPGNFDPSLLTDEQERIQKLLISDIKPGKQQPRTQIDDTALNELAASIKQHGILQPIIVRNDNGTYFIVAGERRWRAAQQAGLSHVPAIVRSLQELEELELALVENVQREDLSPLDQALSIHRLIHQFNIAQDQVAARLGKASSTVGNIVRLLGLPPEAQKALRAGQISEGHARSILSVKDPQQQLELLELIITRHWNVRQAEQFAVAARKGAKTEKAHQQAAVTTTPATEKLSQRLGTPVSIRRLAKGGKLEIAFKSNSDLNKLLKKLS